MISSPEHRIVSFFKRYVSENGVSPTMSEIMNGIGYHSKGPVFRYVQKLIDRELLINNGGKRGLQLSQPEDFQPLMGRIVAGSPLEAIPESDQINFLDKLKVPGLYWLQVSEECGDSMIDVNINPGDYVGVKPAQTAQNNDIVVALIDKQEATLKTFYQCKSYIELRPENPKYKPQRYAHDRVEIQAIHKITVSFR